MEQEGAARFDKALNKDEMVQSKSLTSLIGEDSGALAVRAAGEVVRYVDNMIPEFDLLKDCVHRLIKVNTFLMHLKIRGD
jgi:hypothetical protein